MKPPILFIGDIHFHNYKNHSQLYENGMNSRLADGLDVFSQAHSLAVKTGCKLMCVTGDVFHVRGVVKPSVFNEVAKAFSRVVRSGIDVVVIAGNHDFENFNYGTVSIEGLGYIRHGKNGVYVATEPTAFDLHGYNILGIPYVHDIDSFKAKYEELSKRCNPDITLIHQGIDEIMPDVPREGVTVEYLETHNKGFIFAGHYHFPLHKARVINVGAPYQQSFNDESVAMGCWTCGGAGALEFHELKAPKFLTVKEKLKDWGTLKGNIVRVIGKKAATVETLVQAAKDAGAISVVAQLEKEFKSVHDTPIKISTPEKMLSEYIDMQEKYKPHKEKLMNLFEKVCVGVTV